MEHIYAVHRGTNQGLGYIDGTQGDQGVVYHLADADTSPIAPSDSDHFKSTHAHRFLQSI